MEIETLVKANLSIHRGLLGNVFPNLRAISMYIENKIIYIYFYHDKELSESEEECVEHTMDQVIADFVPYSEIEILYAKERVDYPKKLPPLKGQWVYYRYEE